MSQTNLTIALAGNPNCGKTSIFNALTGANQHVGNYSGVTVEKKDGSFKHNDQEVTVIDLPGTYSLSYHSPEERVAQDELLSGKIDLVVAIVDSTCLSRSLVFVAQLMQLNLPMILCLNMWDEAEKAELKLKIDDMSKLLGMPVIKTVAPHKIGIDELKDKIVDSKNIKSPLAKLTLGDHVANALKKLKNAFPESLNLYPDWIATKLLLKDKKFTDEVKALKDGDKIIKIADEERKHIETDTKMDIDQYITERYYGFVDGLLKEVTEKKQRANARETSDKIDKILAHPVLGILCLAVIAFVLFFITFKLGNWLTGFIEDGFEAIKQGISGGSFEENHGEIHKLITGGIIDGVGSVLVFIPQVVLIFLGLSFLEDTGYIARAAFLIDKFMHLFGLHGRSVFPLLTGFGCGVPGIMATRTIAGLKERLVTIFIVPFMSCGARLPIWFLLLPILLGTTDAVDLAIGMIVIYFIGFIVGLFVALALRKTVYKGEEEPFVMELPPYRMPTAKAIFMHMWERTWLYLKKAGTIILAAAVLLWAATNYPGFDEEETNAAKAEFTQQISTSNEQSDKDMFAAYSNYIAAHPDTNFEDGSTFDQKVNELLEAQNLDRENEEHKAQIAAIEDQFKTSNPALATDKEAFDAANEFVSAQNNYVTNKELENSIMGNIGSAIAPIFAPLGFDWKLTTAILGALAAKEVFVSQMGIVYSLGEVEGTDEFGNDGGDGELALQNTLAHNYSPLTILCIMIFMLFSAPCIAAFGVAKRESNSWKFAFAQFFGMFAIAWVLAFIVNLIGHLFT